MQFSITLPGHVTGFDPATIPDWARAVEDHGFAALSVSDRPSWSTPEPLTALAGAAAVTTEVGLMSGVLLAPPYANAGAFATAAATIDGVAGPGRLRLGLAPGARPWDYAGAPVEFSERGPSFDRWLDRLRGVWDGADDLGPRPVTPGGPPLLFGGSSAPALRRVATAGSGWIAGGTNAAEFAGFADRVRDSWTTAGRTGLPHLAVSLMVALGPHRPGTGTDAVAAYYADLGDRHRDGAVAATLTTPDDVRTAVRDFASAGADEIILTPNDTDPATLDPLHDALHDALPTRRSPRP